MWERGSAEEGCQEEGGEVSGVQRERKVRRDMGGSRSGVVE